jgi:hypothetical protein
MSIARKKIVASSNIYTAFLAVSFGILIATIGFVAFKCFTQYGSLFKIP